MTAFFYHLRNFLLERHGTLTGNERNVHRTRSGPGRMPPNRGWPVKPGRRTKIHRRVSTMVGSLADYDRQMSEHLRGEREYPPHRRVWRLAI